MSANIYSNQLFWEVFLKHETIYTIYLTHFTSSVGTNGLDFLSVADRMGKSDVLRGKKINCWF